MRVLLMGQHYAPEEISGAVLATEIAEDLVKWGNQVTFLTCAPSHPKGIIFPGYKNWFFRREEYRGVQVIRIWSYISPQKTFWRRILNYGTFSASTFYGGIFAERPDVIFSASPPLPLGLSAWLLSRLWKVPWVLRVEDLYPDAAVAAGLLKNKRVIAFFAAIERFLYKKATHISVISQGFRNNLIQKNVQDNKISVTPVWADPSAVQPMAKDNEFRNEHGLEGKFVILYAGNIGYNSVLEDVIEAAELLRAEECIRFVIVGEGVKKASLQEMVSRYDLHNVDFYPYQPREKYPEMLAAADLGLVTLTEDSYYTSLPSKVFNIMASGRPILAITPPSSEIAGLLGSAQCGLNVAPSSPDKLVEVILTFLQDEQLVTVMGRNGRTVLEEQFSREQCIRMYDRLFHSLVDTNHELNGNKMPE
ncbi:MAG: glycosyltransferase family 4 protein [Chloroflexi bacterium]|nr:glycosyltransferase family 4 protein [Chloroflexota bacterium]